MLILLPPSETKRPGGDAAPLDIEGLSFPSLGPQRQIVVDALQVLSLDEDIAARVLKLGATQRHEIAVNTALRTAPTMPAIDRYTGVLFDALDAASLSGVERRWLGAHAAIHSAPFGPIGALDRIPAYRLGASASLPGVAPLRRIWADAVTAALVAAAPRFVLDLRSEAYAVLGPVPNGVASAYVRVVSESEGGAVRALNHFNKHAKGALVRRLAETRPRIGSAAALRRWADDTGVRLRPAPTGEWELVV